MPARTKISNRVVCKLGTIAHNRRFSEADLRESLDKGWPMGMRKPGGSARTILRLLVKRGVVARVPKDHGPAGYFPTRHGWDVIERACRLRR